MIAFQSFATDNAKEVQRAPPEARELAKRSQQRYERIEIRIGLMNASEFASFSATRAHCDEAGARVQRDALDEENHAFAESLGGNPYAAATAASSASASAPAAASSVSSVAIVRQHDAAVHARALTRIVRQSVHMRRCGLLLLTFLSYSHYHDSLRLSVSYFVACLHSPARCKISAWRSSYRFVCGAQC